MKNPLCPKCGKQLDTFGDGYWCSRDKLRFTRDLTPWVSELVAPGIPFAGEYLGGHSMYADKRNVTLRLCAAEVRIDPLDIRIPYSEMKEVKNVNESNMKALRVIALGVVGALWKKKETYLCLVYNDGIQEQNPVLRIDKLDEVQRAIYQHVIQAKKASK